jgi:transcription elongation factor/antiterminator RfaH
MSSANDISCWYVVNTHPKQENRADMNLRAWGITMLNPKIREREYTPYSKIDKYVIKPLFPRYIFAQFSISKLEKVQFTRGVYKIVSFGDSPTHIDDEIISEIQSRIGDGGYIKVAEELAPGDRVVITYGPMATFRGIFVSKACADDRVRILLETLSYQAHLEIERGAIKKSAQ